MSDFKNVKKMQMNAGESLNSKFRIRRLQMSFKVGILKKVL